VVVDIMMILINRQSEYSMKTHTVYTWW